MSSESKSARDVIAQEAAEWIVRRDRGLTPAGHRQFAAWREADPRHEAELRRIDCTWTKLDSAGSAPELVAMAERVFEQARARRRHRRIRRTMIVGLGAAAALAVGVFSWSQLGPDREDRIPRLVTENYRVLASTMRSMTLPDGSKAELNGSSRIEVAFTPAERRVILVEGEAHFIVEKNPDRPFFVTAGPVTVRAVGTAFNVRLETASIEVLVTEGQVKLEHASSAATASGDEKTAAGQPDLVRGQRAVINLATPATPANLEVAEVTPGQITDALGWQSTRLIFSNTPLDEVIAGFNHYNTHKLALGDARLRNRTLTGVFRADNLEGFMRLLEASVDVRTELRAPTETVLLPAR